MYFIKKVAPRVGTGALIGGIYAGATTKKLPTEYVYEQESNFDSNIPKDGGKWDQIYSSENVIWESKSGTYSSPNKIDSLLDGRPELTGSTRDKLLATVQDPELSKIVKELYRPGATVGDGGTAAILVEEFSKGSSIHLLKTTERLKQLKKLASSGKLGLNDLDVVEALIDDLESAISLYN